VPYQRLYTDSLLDLDSDMDSEVEAGERGEGGGRNDPDQSFQPFQIDFHANIYSLPSRPHIL